MAHPRSYEPSTGIEKWIDHAPADPRLMYDQFLAFPTPRNLNYWWTFGGILTFMLVSQIATGVVLAMHYVADAGLRLRQRRAHHARRELGLAAALYARGRRLDVLPRRLYPHLPRPLLRLLQGAARSAVDPRRAHPAS